MGMVATSSAIASGTPDVQLSSSASKPLYGESSDVSVTASLANGQPKGYNLSFRVVLPAGISYAGGSTITPTSISNAPTTGKTTLIFSNVSDLIANSSQTVSFKVNHDPLVYEVGDSYQIDYQAFVNSDPRLVPSFNNLGVANAPSYTGSANSSTTTKISAIKITKSEPSREAELLRGVHDHQTIYTLTLRNNLINPTTATTIDDWLPAGLEFLSCEGTDDHTTDAPTNPGSTDEYPGSGPIDVAAVTECHEPALVETVKTDPDGAGPLPLAVYTHVLWNTGDLTAGQTLTYRYRAAVPLAENTLDFNGASAGDGTAPDPASNKQAVNLDNNNGPETTDEQALTNYALAQGDYQGTRGGVQEVSSDHAITRTAEDLLVWKDGSSSVLEQGGDTSWKLTFKTGEYRYSDNITVIDTLPSGLCPLGPVNYTTNNDASDSECDPTGANPDVAYTDVKENADGTFTIKWDPTALAKLTHTTVNDTFYINFPTKTRKKYQDNFLPTTPIVAKDDVSNKVDLTGSAFSRCVSPGTPDCATTGPQIWSNGDQPEAVVDASSAGQSAPSVSLHKEVALSGTDCQAATYGNTIPTYNPGDRVCWRLTIDFPSKVDTKELRATDFLPRNAQYIAGSYQDTGLNTTINTIDTSDAASGVLNWDMNGTYVPVGAQKFQVTFATKTVPPTGIIPPVDIEGNLLKFGIQNTPGVAFPLRDQQDFKVITPLETIKKGVKQVNSGTVNNPPIDGVTVKGSDLVTYQIDVKSTLDTKDVEVWDQLPAAFDCTMVSAISDSGVCSTSSGISRIKWTVPAINDGATKSLTYKVLIPGTFGPENTYTNNSGVRSYQADTNLGERYTYVPANNIDPNAPAANVARVDDPSNVKTPNVGMSKTRTTSISETGNALADQATIGETINYTVTATLPALTTFGTNAKITDTPDSATTQPIIGTPTATLNGGPLPSGWSINTVGQTVTVNIPDNYPVDATADVVVISISTRVADVSGNLIGNLRDNRANITWKDNTVRSRNSNLVQTRIVEPQIAQGKTNDVNPGTALPGQLVTYTLITNNSNASFVSIAHDTVIVDHVPVGVTPVDASSVPLADGAVVPGTGGAVWNSATRTITSSPVNINPNSSVIWTYKVTVDIPAINGSKFKNTADAKTTSIDGSDPNERTSTSTSHNGYIGSSESVITVRGSTITKEVDPAWVTIGTPVNYTAKLTIPKNLEFFNLTAADVLPDSLDFDGYVASSCVSGCSVSSPAPTVQTYNATINSGLTNIGWDLGHVDAGTADRVIQFTYKAHVRNTHRNGGAPVLAGQNVVNTIHSESNLTNKFSFDANNLPATGTFDNVSPNAQTTTPVREPSVSLDKRVKTTPAGSFVNGPAQSQAGDALTYSIAVKNNGTSAAYDVVVTDQPDNEITNVALAAGAAFNTKAWTPADHTMKWVIPGPIAPGDTVTLTYTANAVSSASLHTGDSAINTAGSTYHGIPQTEQDTHPTWVYRDYTSNNDQVKIDFEFPEISIDKTTTQPGHPELGDATVEQPFGWKLVIRNNATTAKAIDTLVHDTLPPAWSYNAGSTSITGATGAEPTVVNHPTGDVLTWNFSGQTIQPGASVTITFTATPGLDARNYPDIQTNDSDVITKDASGSDHNADGPYTDEDDAKATLHYPKTDLLLDKSAPAEVGPTDNFDYTIKVTNKGPDTATQVVIDDPLPAGLTFVSSPDCSSAAVCNLGTIPALGSKTVVIHVKANYLVAGTTLKNTATVTGHEFEPTPEDNTDTVYTHVLGEANVKIVKTASPANPRPGDVVTYTLKASNIGTAIAQDVVITDSIPVGVTFVSADAPCTEAAATVTCEIGSLGVGEEKTYTVRGTVDQWGDADPAADHLLDVQKTEAQIDLDAGQTRTVSVKCPAGYFVSDGSVRVDHIDQGTGTWASPEVLKSRATADDTWEGTVKNTATGRAQAKIFAVCISRKTVDGPHSHDLIISSPITVSDEALAGKKTATLMCGPGQIAIAPGFESSAPGDLVYSEPEGNGWKFILDLHAPAHVTFQITCLTRQVSITDGHTHDLKLEHIATEVTIQPGTVNEAQLTCADGSKGIVADQDLDEGLIPLGNDPRPVTRAFKIYNPTDHALKARISLLCLGLRTGGEHLPPKLLTNTAYISTSSIETQTGNNSSSASVTAEDTDNYTPVPDPDPVKPVVNNPVAGRIASAHGGTLSLRLSCISACQGVAKVTTSSVVKVKGKKFKKGTVLAKGRYKIDKAGTSVVHIKATRAGKKLFKGKKKAHGLLTLTGGVRKFITIK